MSLILGLIFGSVGFVYFVWGKKEHDPMFLVVGIALMIYPYFFDNAWLVLIIGAALCAFPVAKAKGLF